MALLQILRGLASGPASRENGPGAGGAYKTERALFVGALVLVSILGIGLRAGFLSKPYYQVDEGVTLAIATGLDLPSRWTTNWANYDVPPEFRYDEFNFSSYHYLAHGWLQAVGWAGPKESRLTVLRALNLPLALAALIFTALAARHVFGWLPGVFAAAVVAVLPILVQDAHYARCDSMLTAGVAALVWLLAPGAIRARWHWVLIGAVAGWLVACKFSLVLVGPFLLGAVSADHAGRASPWADACRCCGWLLLGGVVGVALGMPGALADPHAFLRGVRTLRAYYDGFHPPYSLPDRGPVVGLLAVYIGTIVGPGILGLAGLGAAYAGYRLPKTWVGGLLGALVVPFVVFGAQSFIAERNLSPFLPLMVFLAAGGAAQVLAWLTRFLRVAGRWVPAIAALVLLVTLAAPFNLSLRMVTRGFSLKEQQEQNAFVQRVAADAAKQKLVFASGSLADAEGLALAEAVLRDGPTLFAIYDFQDDNTKGYVARLARVHNGRVVATREGLFPGLPCCTLTTMISARILVVQCGTPK